MYPCRTQPPLSAFVPFGPQHLSRSSPLPVCLRYAFLGLESRATAGAARPAMLLRIALLPRLRKRSLCLRVQARLSPGGPAIPPPRGVPRQERFGHGHARHSSPRPREGQACFCSIQRSVLPGPGPRPWPMQALGRSLIFARIVHLLDERPVIDRPLFADDKHLFPYIQCILHTHTRPRFQIVCATYQLLTTCLPGKTSSQLSRVSKPKRVVFVSPGAAARFPCGDPRCGR